MGRAMSECRICGRGLADPTSLERGVGPVCWRCAHPEMIGHRPRARSRRRVDSAEQLELDFATPTTPAPIEPHPLDIPDFLRRAPR
jgi:hypothetical protein